MTVLASPPTGGTAPCRVSPSHTGRPWHIDRRCLLNGILGRFAACAPSSVHTVQPSLLACTAPVPAEMIGSTVMTSPSVSGWLRWRLASFTIDSQSTRSRNAHTFIARPPWRPLRPVELFGELGRPDFD